MNYRRAKETYLHDPLYRNFVDVLYNMIETLQLSPSEIREAAIFACILFEEKNPKPIIIEREDDSEKTE